MPASLRREYQEGDPIEKSNDDILVGTWRTPDQFVNKAQQVTHPMDECALEEITKDAIRFVSKLDPRLVSVERRKNFLKARIMAKQLEEQEIDLHRNLPESVEKVVGGKRILLWKRLLEQNGYDDMGVVKFMTEGMPLVGSHDHPSCYPLKLKTALMSEEELRDLALPCRTALENRRPQTEARGFAEHLAETAAEEVKVQFLEGPFYSSAEVSEALRHDQRRIMRRFVIEQASKLRPIDDGLEAQLNAAYTSPSRLDLQDADYVVVLTPELGKTGDLCWVGKTLDLAKAYTQLPILPGHRDLAVTFFRDRNRKLRYYIYISLMPSCSDPLQQCMPLTGLAGPCGFCSMYI